MATTNIPKSIGKYEILSVLGRGGMGVVYKGRDPHIDRIVAVKTILTSQDGEADEDLVSRLRAEARSAGRLHHPNIVTIFDFGQQDELAFIVMEFIEGINLGRVVEERRPLELTTKIDIILQIAAGLGYAHDQGVIHRDMKPANVCVTANGAAKVLDFGLARMDDTKLTKTGFISGTIAYMSPERFSGVTGIQDDLFALGAIAYEILTYRRAFPGSAPPEIISKIISPEGPPKPSEVVDLPPGIDEVIAKALSKDAETRYQSAAEFAHDLRNVARSQAFDDFVSDPVRIAAMEEDLIEFAKHQENAASAYSAPSSGKRTSQIHPTLIVPTDPALRSDFGTARGSSRTPTSAGLASASDDRTEMNHTAMTPDRIAARGTTASTTRFGTDTSSADPTQIIAQSPAPSSKRGPLIGGVAAVVVIAALAGFLMTRGKEPASPGPSAPPPPKEKQVEPRTADPQRAENGQLQLATARSMFEELSRKGLSTDDRIRLSEANARVLLAEQKLREHDYDAAARLTGDAVAGMRALIASGSVPATGTVTSTASSKTPPAPKRPEPAKVPTPTPQPVPPTPQRPTPVPAPVPEPQPVRPVPAPAPPTPPSDSAEKEVTAFIRELARAYQAKDVAFFRENALQYSEAFGNAIRNSPSVRVDMQIIRVEITDPQRATVHVRRTDTFPDPAMPAGVQTLVYRLQRQAGGWKLASVGR